MMLGRVLFHTVVNKNFQPGSAQGGDGPLRMAGGFQTRIGDQQHAAAAELANQLTELG